MAKRYQAQKNKLVNALGKKKDHLRAKQRDQSSTHSTSNPENVHQLGMEFFPSCCVFSIIGPLQILTLH